MKALIGLGNPGSQYEQTRHNLGFLVVRHIAEKQGLSFSSSRTCRGLEAAFSIAGEDVKLLMPMTFMNLSGSAVRPFMAVCGISLQDMLVVYDDIHLPFGQIRIRRKGSDGGHNGVRSVIESLGADEFPRLRLGVGEPKGKQDAADFVLAEFEKKEKELLDGFIQEAAECCQAWVVGEIDEVMSQFNKRKGDG